MRDISHDSSEPASHGSAASEGASKHSEPRSEGRPAGHRPSAAAQAPATLVPEAGWHFLHLFYRVDRARLGELSTAPEGAGTRGVAADPGRQGPGRAGAAPVLRGAGPQGRLRHHHGRPGPPRRPRRPDVGPGVAASGRPCCRRIRSTRSPRSPSTSPTPSSTARSSAIARASTRRAASTRPRSPPMPSGSAR